MPLSALLCCLGERPEVADEVKVGLVIKRLEAAGWLLVATRGSHRQFKHPIRPGMAAAADLTAQVLQASPERRPSQAGRGLAGVVQALAPSQAARSAHQERAIRLTCNP